MKFLLIYPPGDEESSEINKPTSTYAPPLGLLYIASIVKKQGHEAIVIDARGEKIDKENIKKQIESADIIGITIPSFSLNSVKKIVSLIREVKKEIYIIAGGPHCTLLPEETLNLIDLDAVIQGEGELGIKAFAEAYEKRDLSSVPGLFYRESGKIKKGKPPETIDNLDEIPFPAHDLVNKYDYGYVSEFKIFNRKFTSMITSRGCPYRCSFCNRDIFIKRNYRQRSADNVLKEIEFIVNQGYDGIIIVDDNFLLDKKRTEKIMDGIIDRKFDITLIVEGARVDSADKELYKKMWDAGVRMISYGIESANPDVLDFYNKNITLEQVRKAVKLAYSTGFFVTASFIIGAPFETKKHFENTIDFACSLPIDFVEFYILDYRMGSDLWKDAVDNGIIHKNDFFIRSCKENNLSQFSLNELAEWRKKAYTKFYLRPSYLLRESIKLIKSGNPNLLKATFPIISKI